MSPQAATVFWQNRAGGSWKVASNWEPPHVPGANDQAFLSTDIGHPGYSVTIDGSVTIGALSLGPGVKIELKEKDVLTFGNPASVLPEEPGRHHRLGGLIENAGTVRFSVDAYVDFGGPFRAVGVLVNLTNGVVELLADVSLSSEHGPYIDNQGIFRKIGGLGASTIQLPVFNRGTVDVQSGTLRFGGWGGAQGTGLYHAAAGTTLEFATKLEHTGNISGSGTNLLTGDLTLHGAILSSNFIMKGDLSGTNQIVGKLTFMNGGLHGKTTVEKGSVAVMAPGEPGLSKIVYGSLINAGTMQFQAETTVSCSGFYGGGTLLNLPGALIDFQGDNAVITARSGHFEGTISFDNQGVLRKSSGGERSDIQMPFRNDGVVEVNSGSLQIYTPRAGGTGVFKAREGAKIDMAGAYTAEEGTVFEGAGTNFITGRLRLEGNVISSNAVVAGGYFEGTNGILRGIWEFSRGQIANDAELTVSSNSVLRIVGDASDSRSIYGRLLNSGVIQMEASVGLSDLHGPGQIINLPNGVMDMTRDLSIWALHGPNASIVNEGLFRKSDGEGTADISAFLVNTSKLDVRRGTLRIAGDGRGDGLFNASTNCTIAIGKYTAGNGASFTGTGIALLTDRFTIEGQVKSSNLLLFGGSLEGTNATVQGAWTIERGDITAGSRLTIAAGGVLNVRGSNGDRGLFGELRNAGLIRMDADISFWDGGALLNLPGGVIDVQRDVEFSRRNQASGSLINDGTIRKSGGLDRTYITIPFTNKGLLDVQSGIVHLTAAYTLAGGTLRASISSETLFGSVHFDQAHTLDGTVSVELLGSYLPKVENAFRIITYNSMAGVFPYADLPALYVWETNYGPNAFSVRPARPASIIIGLQPQSQVSVLGQPVVFRVGDVSPGAAQYQWVFNGSPIPGATSPALSIPVVRQADVGSYNVIVRNELTNAISRVVTLSLRAAPLITSQPLSISADWGGNAVFAVAANNAAGYQWKFNGQNITGAMHSTLVLSNLTASAAGVYTVEITNSSDSVVSQPATLMLFGNLQLYAGIMLAGPIGAVFQIEYSENLDGQNAWQSLTNLALPNSPFLFVDPQSATKPQRYYRASLVPSQPEN